MKKFLKNSLFLILTISILLAITFTVSAADIVETGSCGENVTYTLDSDGLLTISGTGQMNTYLASSPAPWYSNRSFINRVVIENGVTNIGYYALYNCTNLTSVTIPDSVTSIGASAFLKCISLKSIKLPDSVTSIGYSAFYKCTVLENIELGNGVISIGNQCFYDCKSLISIKIPDSVTSIFYDAFSNCTNLETIYITDIKAWCNIEFENSLSNPLYYAKKLYFNGELLTELVIPDNATNISNYAFSNYTPLTSIKFSDNVTSIGASAFLNCINLTDVTIPDSVTSIGISSFKGCTNLESITLPFIGESRDSTSSTSVQFDHIFGGYEVPKSLKNVIITDATSIGYSAFSGCTDLTSIIIPDSVTSIGCNAFYYCTSLKSIRIPDSVTVINSYAFSNCTSLETVEMGNGVTTICDLAFNNCASLVSIKIPDTVTSICHSAFKLCTSLESVYINDLLSWCNIEFGYSANPLSYAKNLYLNGEPLTELVIPDSVSSIKPYAFNNYTGLTSVIIPKNVTLIGEHAFNGCTNLVNVEIENGVTTIEGSAFFGCTGLTSVTIPDSVISIGPCAFAKCTSLTKITVSKNNTVFSTDAQGILYNKDKTELIASTVSKTSVIIPDSVTKIRADAFYYCSSLTSVTIPKSVTDIEFGEFIFCENLTIHGYSGSYAETYAAENEIPFVVISDNIAEGTIGDTINWAIEPDGTLRISGEGALPDYERNTNRAPWFDYKKSVKSIIVEDGITRIGRYAFYQSRATSIDIAHSVEFIGQYFIRESYLAEITLDWNVKLEYYAFGRADRLKTIIFTEDVKNFMGNLFNDYEFAATIKAPTGSYAHKYTELYASKYPDCSDTVSLTFESTGEAVTPIVEFAAAGINAFFAIYQKSASNWIVEVSGRGDMKNFPYISEKNKAKGYKFCPMYYIVERDLLEEQNISKVVVHDDITTIGNYAFYKINKCTDITFPDTITFIGNGAFWNFVKMTSITIPETVTEIGKHAFNGCAKLTNVVIPNSVTKIGEEIFVKCDTENMTVHTDNPIAIEYLEKYYPEINIQTSYKEMYVRVVGTENYSLNGAEKATDLGFIAVAPVNENGALGTTVTLKLQDLGLESYENNTDALIGLDIAYSEKDSAIIPEAKVLGTLKSASVSASDGKVIIDGTSYDSVNELVYGDGTVTTTSEFTEISDLVYANEAFALDHEGDGVIDAIAVNYIKLAKVIEIKDGKYYVASDVEADTSAEYLTLSDETVLAEGDVFVYTEANGKVNVEEVITPVTAKATKVTSTVITLADVGDVSYVDGSNGATYLKNSLPIILDAVELLDKDAEPLTYYVYNNYIVAASYPPAPDYYNLALLLYAEEPTEPVYNPETKKVEIYYPAVLLIDGEETTVNLKAIDGVTAETVNGVYSLAQYYIGADNEEYHYILVNYTVDRNGLYTLNTTASDLKDTVVVPEGSTITLNKDTALYTIDGKTFVLDEKSVLYYVYESEGAKQLGAYTALNIPTEFDPIEAAQETYLLDNGDGTYTLIATVLAGKLNAPASAMPKSYTNDARLIRYCAEGSMAEAIDGVAYYSHLFLDFETMKNGSRVVDTSLSIIDGATKTEAGYFYGRDRASMKYVKITEDNTSAVRVATLTGVDTARGILYLDGAEFNVDGVYADFTNGVKLDSSVKLWATAGNNCYTYKTFDVSSLAELYEFAGEKGITLEAAVGVYADDDEKLKLAWILVDNYYYQNETLTKTTDLVSRLKSKTSEPPIEERDYYNLALLLYVKEQTSTINPDYPATLLIGGNETTVKLNVDNAIDGKAATDAYVRAHEISEDANGYAVYSYTLVNYRVNSDGTYSLYTTATDLGDTVVVESGVISPDSYTGLYSIDGKTFKLDGKSVIYYTYDNTDTDPANTFKYLGTYTKDNIPTEFDPIEAAQETYLLDNGDGTYTLIATVLSGKLTAPTVTAGTYKNDARLIRYCAEDSAAEAIDGVAYYSYLFLDMETMKNGSQVVDTSLSISNGATKAEAGNFYGWDKALMKYVRVTEETSDAVKAATLTGVDAARGILYLDGAEFNVDGASADFSNGVIVSENVKIWGTAGNNRYTYKTFDVSALAELYELASDNLKTLNAAVGVYVDESGSVQIAWIIVDNYYYVGTSLTKTADIVSSLGVDAPPVEEQPPIEETEDEYNLALLLYVKEPTDPVYNEIKHKYEVFYPAVLLIDGKEITVNLNDTKAIDGKVATDDSVRAHEIATDANGHAVYSYTLVNYTIDRYGAYSLYTTASDFGNTVAVPAGAVISFNEYTGLYMIDGKAFELDEKSVIYYVDEIDGSKQLCTYTIANMPTDFAPVTVNQTVYLRKNSDGVYTLIATVIFGE